MKKFFVLFSLCLLSFSACARSSHENPPSELEEVKVPEISGYVWEDFNSIYDHGQEVVDSLQKDGIIPFDLDMYSSRPTPYGILFTNKGEMKQVDALGDADYMIEYEAGVQPDFKWYDFQKKSFLEVPEPSFQLSDDKFERIYNLQFSSSEPKLLLEVGLYDIHSESFQGGMVGSQPTEMRGMVYDIASNSFEDANESASISNYVAQHWSAWVWPVWDSAQERVVEVPGGEGCGPYSTLTFVDLKSGVAELVGGNGGLNFVDYVCNPSNGFSPDNRWVILSGLNRDGLFEVRLYSLDRTLELTQTVPVGSKEEALQFQVSAWDLHRECPAIQFFNFVVVDFNK